MNRPIPRAVSFCLFVLGVLQITAMFVALERPAQAYVDPGSGFVFLQVAGSMVAGSAYYLRHRLKRLFSSLRKPSQIPTPAGTQSEVIENQP